MIHSFRFLAAITTTLFAGSVFAAVSADEAKQLGAELTAFGAEKAGNKDGTIPEYVGQKIQPPVTYNPKDPGQRPDPFNERPLFSITAQNLSKYEDRMTEGQKIMFKRYPSFRMDIYPTHRTMVYPKYVLDNSVKNATSCKGVDDELGIEGCYGGIPFPIPKTGNQVMWNHLLHFESYSIKGGSKTWFVAPDGNRILQSGSFSSQTFPMFDPDKKTAAVGTDLYFKARVDSVAPVRLVGEKYMIFDYVNNLNPGRRAWVYIPGQRRVKLSPDLAYDTPAPGTGGAATIDDAKGFLGALDRYDFKLIGKKEKYIPYNMFIFSDSKVCPVDILAKTKNYPNPDCVRWELHRTWVVEATLKPGFRHVYKKRVFYWDEDSYGAGVIENYDASGSLYRFGYPISIPLYPDYGAASGTTVWSDLQTGAYLLYGALGETGLGFYPVSFPKDTWSPEALAGSGIR